MVAPLHGLSGDVRLAARRLRATPLFLVFAVVSLAIGIGVTTAAYSLLYTLFWKPLAVREPHRVVFIATPTPSGRLTWPRVMSRSDFDDLRATQRSFRFLAASQPFGQTLAGPRASESVDGEAVTGDYFLTAGIEAIVGRSIRPTDDETAAAVAVLSYRTWRIHFDSDPRIVGRVVRLGGQPFDVIGVAPRSFEGLTDFGGLNTDIWIPLRAWRTPNSSLPDIDDRERRRLSVIGRLAGQRSAAAASTEIATIAARLDLAYPVHSVRTAAGARPVTPRQWTVLPVNEQRTVGSEWRFTALLLGLIALVLVVACTNLANLMLARGATRQQEFAVRRALGASRWRLIRELSIESAIIAALGGIFTVVVTRGLLVMATVEVPTATGAFAVEPHVNLSVLLVASAALLLSMMIFGLEPALQLTRANVSADLTSGSGTVGVPRSGRQRAFIRWQVAISACFFLVAAVLAKVLVAEARHDPGVDVDRLSIATVHFTPLGWDESRARRTLEAAVDLLRQDRTIESVSVSSGTPFGMIMTPHARITTPDKPFTANVRDETAYLISATPDIFRTLGVPIIRGRGLDWRDDATAPRVMVVSEWTARRVFGTADAVGRQMLVQSWGRPPTETYTIVGIARDTDSQSLMSRNTGTTYVPLAQHYEPNLAVVARTPGDPAATTRLLQTALRRVDPDLATGMAGAASIVLAGPFVAARIAASLATALGLLTLILAMVGLYGVQSHMVTRRTREVGLRMALGAHVTEIERMVLREGFKPVVEGVILGLVFGTIVRLGLRAFIPNVQVVDPLAFALVPIPLCLAALLACYVPARRAARVDPNVALRHL